MYVNNILFRIVFHLDNHNRTQNENTCYSHFDKNIYANWKEEYDVKRKNEYFKKYLMYQ